MIVKANDILSNNSNVFTSEVIHFYWITSQTKPTISYRLAVEDNQSYPGFKFVYCTCIGIHF